MTRALVTLESLALTVVAFTSRQRVARLERELRTVQADIERQIERRTAELEAMVLRDPLTGLYNRRFLDEELERVTSAARRSGDPVALAVVDVDSFKAINDTRGHGVGDAVLRRVARALTDGVRAEDVVARLGGDELVIVWPRTPTAHAHEAAERLRQAVAGLRWPDLAPDLHVTASFGVVGAAGDVRPQRLLERADELLFDAKRAGRNAVAVGTLDEHGPAADTS